MIRIAFIPPPAAPLLGTTGTELLLFGLLVAAGVYFLRAAGRDASRFVPAALVAVSLFYLLCPEDSAFQRRAGEALMSGMAALQAETMRLFGAAVRAEGPSVVGAFPFVYARGCMGLTYLAAAVLCLLFYPISWRRRLVGAAAVAAGMTALNLVRLIVLYLLWEGEHTFAYEAFHRAGGAVFAAGGAALFSLAVRLRIGAPENVPSAALAPGSGGA
ncbi:MAG TPA: archaeosortase/exosortase family protein [Planctomycetota bacterium]|nr:archaeosortase/exosortase family protein [Planctomycetota bacterium]